MKDKDYYIQQIYRMSPGFIEISPLSDGTNRAPAYLAVMTLGDITYSGRGPCPRTALEALWTAILPDSSWVQ